MFKPGCGQPRADRLSGRTGPGPGPGAGSRPSSRSGGFGGAGGPSPSPGLGTGRSGGPGAALRTSLAATRRRSASCPPRPPNAAAGPGSGLGLPGRRWTRRGLRARRPRARHPRRRLPHCSPAGPEPPAFPAGRGASSSRDASPPGLVTWAARPLRQSQSWLREASRRRRLRRQLTGRRSGCQVLVSPPPPPPSAVPGWARPSWSGSGPPPVPCEVCRRRPCAARDLARPRRPPESLALGSPSPPPVGSNARPVKVQARPSPAAAGRWFGPSGAGTGGERPTG